MVTREQSALDAILSNLESEVYDTIQAIEDTFETSTANATDIVRDFLKEKF